MRSIATLALGLLVPLGVGGILAVGAAPTGGQQSAGPSHRCR